MKKSLFLIVGILTLCAFVGSANALLFTSTYDPLDKYVGNDVAWTANLVNEGYNPNSMVLQNATLTVNLADDSRYDGNEDGLLKVQIGEHTEYFLWWSWTEADYNPTQISDPTATFVHVFTPAELNWLQGGITSMIVSNTTGDFTFLSASLAANTASVPEPATMLLLGLGLVGLVGFGRKKFNS